MDILKLVEEIESLKEQNELLRQELREQTYMGNSVGYIYDKMIAYSRQVESLRKYKSMYESMRK